MPGRRSSKRGNSELRSSISSRFTRLALPGRSIVQRVSVRLEEEAVDHAVAEETMIRARGVERRIGSIAVVGAGASGMRPTIFTSKSSSPRTGASTPERWDGWSGYRPQRSP
jgi:hypothetical protein